MKRKIIYLFSILMLGLLLTSCTQQNAKVYYYPPVVPLSQIQDMNPKVLAIAKTAYENAQCQGKIKHPYLTIVDFSKPSNEKRLWVINMDRQEVLFYTYVSHGKNSGDF